MAKKRAPKVAEVKSFGGVEDLGVIREEGNDKAFHSYLSDKDYQSKDTTWDAKSIETSSKTNLEQDEGYGREVVIRNFKFKIDPNEVAKCFMVTNTYPDKQMLFNSVVKYIESSLWRDGLKVFPDVEPRVVINDTYSEFDVFVGSIPQRGQVILERPKTLSQLVNG